MIARDKGGNLTPERPQAWERAFLTSLSENGGNVCAAAKTAGIVRRTAYDQRYKSDRFRAAWDLAVWEGTDVAIEEVARRAIKGVKKPVYQGGKKVGSVQEYSDALLMFLIKARRKEFCDPKNQFNVNVPSREADPRFL